MGKKSRLWEGYKRSGDRGKYIKEKWATRGYTKKDKKKNGRKGRIRNGLGKWQK